MERIDFTALPKARRQQASKEEQEAAKKDYAHKMAELQAEVSMHTHIESTGTERAQGHTAEAGFLCPSMSDPLPFVLRVLLFSIGGAHAA